MNKNPKRRGRPRNLALDSRILDAALALLGGGGYARMTMEEVAVRARVPKSTLYRRWPTKAALTGAVVDGLQESLPGEASGNPRKDLVNTLERLRKTLANPKSMGVMGALLAEESRHPELIRNYRRKVVAPRREHLKSMLTQTCKKITMRSSMDPDMAANLLMGGLFGQYLRYGKVPTCWPEQAVSALWDGLAKKK